MLLQKFLIVFAIVAMLSLATSANADAADRYSRKPAIVLAAFGTSDTEAVHSILNIVERTEAAFPGYDVHLAFTSNIIRGIWRERSEDAEFRKENPDVPERVYSIKNVLATLANIQETGPRLVLVQSLHVTDGEEYADLAKLVNTLSGYQTTKSPRRPFPWIGVGEPALGVGDGQESYLERAAVAIAPLAEEARKNNAALVLMAHGNEHLNQSVFAKFEQTLRKYYGEQVYIGTVEAPPFAEEIAAAIKETANHPQNVFLAPLMVVAGDHAQNDMAGEEEDSWASVFKDEGFGVTSHLTGMGSNNSWADIYIEHLRKLESGVAALKAEEKEAEAAEE